jgi:hypothetical protein
LHPEKSGNPGWDPLLMKHKEKLSPAKLFSWWRANDLSQNPPQQRDQIGRICAYVMIDGLL